MSFSLYQFAHIGVAKAYPRANFPTLWQRFEALICHGDSRASSTVLAELERIEDESLERAKATAHYFENRTSHRSSPCAPCWPTSPVGRGR